MHTFSGYANYIGEKMQKEKDKADGNNVKECNLSDLPTGVF